MPKNAKDPQFNFLDSTITSSFVIIPASEKASRRWQRPPTQTDHCRGFPSGMPEKGLVTSQGTEVGPQGLPSFFSFQDPWLIAGVRQFIVAIKKGRAIKIALPQTSSYRTTAKAVGLEVENVVTEWQWFTNLIN